MTRGVPTCAWMAGARMAGVAFGATLLMGAAAIAAPTPVPPPASPAPLASPTVATSMAPPTAPASTPPPTTALHLVPPPPPPAYHYSAPPPAYASPPPPAVGAAGPPASYLLEVGLGKSRVLDVRSPYTDLMIADAKIADVIPFSNQSVYVVGKTMGSTSMSVYGPGKRLIAAVNLVVGPDIEGFKTRLHELLPDEQYVEARAAGQSMILSGTVSNPTALSQVVTLAGIYAPEKVVNMLGVEGTQQVMLSVRFVEMERTTAKNLNVTISGSNNANPQFTGASGLSKNISATTPALTPFLVPTTSFGAAAFVINGNIGLEIDALESKGLVKTLAEPSLVAMSGDTASFLAGGEVPIPVAQTSSGGSTGNAAISVEFKQFGIGLGFTPTVLGGGLINLVVKPEVSSLDTANGITSGGVTIPGLQVRRASTTVELRDGESFTIAGLLSDSYQDNISQFPLLGDVPVLGALFRSPSFKRDQTELVIVVTPHLVTARHGPAALPSDHFVPPSDFELFLFGALNGARSGAGAEDRALMSKDPAKGGIDGPYGHVLY